MLRPQLAKPRLEIWPPSGSLSRDSYRIVLPRVGSTCIHLPRGTIRHWQHSIGKRMKWVLLPEGTEGYEKAEVTVGGVDTDELSSKTMESRKVPGLFFIGEVVDVTGHLGGHNFQWAWASGASAGLGFVIGDAYENRVVIRRDILTFAG